MAQSNGVSGPAIAADQLKNLTPEQQRELLEQLLRKKASGARSMAMSVGQQALWHAFRRDPNSTHYNVFLPSRIRSTIQLDALRRAVEQQADRHQALRTTFTDDGGELKQVVHERLRPEFLLRQVPGASQRELERLVLNEALRPFDLERGPLLRQSVFQVADDDFVILAQAHHIVVDFWSLVLILTELRASYPQLAAGRKVALPAPQNNYERFVDTQSTLLSGPAVAQHVDYWRDALQDVAPVVEVPLDKERPSAFTGRADVVGLPLKSGTGRALIQLATDLKVTPFAVVHAAVQLVISRLSGQDLFFVGSPFSGRARREFEQTVGFFVNVLPIRSDLTGDPTFADVVRRTGRRLTEALEHESYPLSEIVQLGNVPRDPGRSPLFQVSCTFEKSQVRTESGRAGFLFPGETQQWDFGGLKQESFYLPHPTCHYDVEFIFELTGDVLKGMVVFCRDLFDTDTLTHIADGFSGLVQAAIANANIPVADIPWPSTTRENLETARQAASSHPDTVCEQIVLAARKNPQHVALSRGDVSLSYTQLVKIAADYAVQIVEQGVEREALIPVCTRDAQVGMVGILAVQLAGAAAVPIDTNQPSLSFDELAKQTGPALVVHDGSDYCRDAPGGLLLELSVDVLQANQSLQWREVEETLAKLPRVTSNELAYMVYTSGSTGVPKGVLVEHAAVTNTLSWRSEAVPLEPDDRVLMLLSHQFDAGLGIAWTTLTQGATLVWADSSRDPDRLIDQVLRDEITVLPAVPSLQELLAANPRFVTCKTLRYLWTGGEAMDSKLPEKIRQQTKARFWNFYGPTEAAIEATACEVRNHPAGRPVPIGNAISGAEIRILDAALREVPSCVPGQIAIGGRGLARGYHNAPELTSERFVEAPDGRGRLYLTGDIGRRRSDGQIEFLGRDDHQIKLRGYRIELGEIEAVIARHPLVQRVAVQVLSPDSPAAHLVAFVSLSDLQQGASDEAAREASGAIEQFASRRLPAYKQPIATVVLPELPLTASGKVDRKQLPASVDIHAHRETVEPHGPLEEFLFSAWCDVLSRRDFGVTQNFFDAGGSSIQAAILTNRLTEHLGVNVPTALIFDLADIRQMAWRLVDLHEETIREQFGLEAIEYASRNSPSESLPPLLTPFRLSGEKTPVFMVHPPGGIVACYRDLADALGDDQPVVGIRSRGLHGDERLPSSIAEMATDYLQAMRQVQPAGPYVVGGWSLGGLVAYEICQQLKHAGEAIEKLVLLDTTIPEQATELVPLVERENVGLEYGIELSLEELGELDVEAQLSMLVEHAQKLGVLDEESPPEVIAQVVEDLQELFHHHVNLSTKYRLEPLDVSCLLLRPSEMPMERPVAHDRGWGYLIPDVAVAMVPGHHHSMVQPPAVTVLAQSISESLAKRS